jgi:galactose-1-phosphate uridylyltransferase
MKQVENLPRSGIPQGGTDKVGAENGIELDEIIQRTREGCVFCPQLIEEKTPEFPPDISPEGRIKIGETIIFPNLNPFGENHAVGIITTEHFLPLNGFSERQFIDNLVASINYIHRVYENNKDAKFPIYVWNYMPPSAGSIIHPHVQIMVEREPLPQQRCLLEKSLEYFQQNKSNYWTDLIEAEREQGSRFIFENDSLALITSFAPRGFNEIQFIFPEISSLTDLTNTHIADFARCLTTVLRGYEEMGIGSFNLATYSGPICNPLDYYCFNIKLISRPFPRCVYTNDTGPMDRLYNVWVIDTLPEQLAEKMRASRFTFH